MIGLVDKRDAAVGDTIAYEQSLGVNKGNFQTTGEVKGIERDGDVEVLHVLRNLRGGGTKADGVLDQVTRPAKPSEHRSTGARVVLAAADIRHLDGRLLVGAGVLDAAPNGWRVFVEEPDGSTVVPAREFVLSNAQVDLLLCVNGGRSRFDGSIKATVTALFDRGLAEASYESPRETGRSRAAYEVKLTDAGRAMAAALAANPVG